MGGPRAIVATLRAREDHMHWIQTFLQKYPELGVYLALGLGFTIGSLKFRGFSLGGKAQRKV